MATFMKNVDIVSHSATLFRDERFVDTPFCGYQSKYILEICRHPGITQEEIAKTLYVNKSNVARQVKVLQKQGYVIIEKKQGNKRANALYPTQSLLDYYPIIEGTHGEWRELLTADFTQDEKEELLRLTQKLSDKAEEIIKQLK